jgi:hypothetical protein
MTTRPHRGYYPGVVGFRRWVGIGFWSALALVLLGSSDRAMRDPADLLHRYTAPIEFDFAGWTLAAIGSKLGQASVDQAAYLRKSGPNWCATTLNSARRPSGGEIERIYADPLSRIRHESSANVQAW